MSRPRGALTHPQPIPVEIGADRSRWSAEGSPQSSSRHAVRNVLVRDDAYAGFSFDLHFSNNRHGAGRRVSG